MIVVTVRGQDQDGSGDLLSSFLPSLDWELIKQPIKFPVKLLQGTERECLLSNCFKCLQSIQTVSASLTVLRTAQYSTVQYITVQYIKVQYSTLLYCTLE